MRPHQSAGMQDAATTPTTATAVVHRTIQSAAVTGHTTDHIRSRVRW
jgi:hypothetical protein